MAIVNENKSWIEQEAEHSGNLENKHLYIVRQMSQ